MKDTNDTKKKCEGLVRHWPITVEIYPTGRIAFIARPIQFGRRWNRTFATGNSSSPEESAAAAIDFCKRVLSGTDAEIAKMRLTHEQKKLARYGISKELATEVVGCLREKIDVLSVLREALEKAKYDELRQKYEGRK